MSLQQQHPDAVHVLNKSVYRAATYLQLKQAVLCAILGLSAPAASRLCKHNTPCIHQDTKEWECALLFLRVIRSLEALLGEDPEQVREWLFNENLHLGAVPIELIKTISGLAQTVDYLDAMRGQC